eukprot:GILK01005150.1.p1 GENE.GILK01005150.1~~GILK01005150.1.p1  ORF type:complete len:355 (-),score=15.74 GILK01005150.1:285-1349(-)
MGNIFCYGSSCCMKNNLLDDELEIIRNRKGVEMGTTPARDMGSPESSGQTSPVGASKNFAGRRSPTERERSTLPFSLELRDDISDAGSDGSDFLSEEVDITSYISKTLVNALNPDDVLCESEAKRWHPGIGNDWVSRWIVLNRIEFKYYRSQLASHGWTSRPLTTIPLSAIKHIRRSETKDDKNEDFYLIEIVIKNSQTPDKSPVHIEDSEAWETASSVSSSSSTSPLNKHALRRPRVQPKHQRTLSTPTRRGRRKWSNMETEMYIAENKYVFRLPNFEAFDKWFFVLRWAVGQQQLRTSQPPQAIIDRNLRRNSLNRSPTLPSFRKSTSMGLAEVRSPFGFNRMSTSPVGSFL